MTTYDDPQPALYGFLNILGQLAGLWLLLPVFAVVFVTLVVYPWTLLLLAVGLYFAYLVFRR